MADKIIPIQKNETIDFSGKKVNGFWHFEGHAELNEKPIDAISHFLQMVKNGVVCIYSEKLEDKSLIDLLFRISEKAHVYILLNDYSKELEPLTGRALLRYSGVKNTGSFVLINPNSNNSEGLFFGGSLTANSLTEHFLFEVSQDDIKELFRHFCYQFWTNAKTEILESGTPKDVTSKPIDIYYDSQKFDGKDYVYGTLFNFVDETERKNLTGEKIIYLSQEKNTPIEIKSETTTDLGDNKLNELLPKHEFELQKPELKDDGVSAKINYLWQNVPFYLPEGAKQHNLYTQWENEKEKISIKLQSFLNRIEELEKKEDTISSRIKRFFLGKKNQFSVLKKQIHELQKVDFPNLSKETRDEKAMNINSISKDIATHSKDIDIENQKALLDEDIEKLQTQLNETKIQLQHIKTGREQKELTRSKKVETFCSANKIENEYKFSAELNILKQQVSRIEKDINNEKLSQNKCENEKINVENEIKTIKESEKQPELFQKKNETLKKMQETIAEAERKIEGLLSTKANFDFKITSIENLQKELKNDDIFIQKDKDEERRTEGEIRRFEVSIGAKQKEKDKLSEEKSDHIERSSLESFSKKSKSNEGSGKNDIQNIPQLPQVGTLYSYERNSFLAIENWEEYDLGKKESERFNAKLCAVK